MGKVCWKNYLNLMIGMIHKGEQQEGLERRRKGVKGSSVLFTAVRRIKF
jgi:hypothetical protein